MCKFNVIENAQELSAILLHCDEAVNSLAYDYNKHKLTHFLLHDTQVTDKASGPFVLFCFLRCNQVLCRMVLYMYILQTR
jgi:hypothetical protein